MYLAGIDICPIMKIRKKPVHQGEQREMEFIGHGGKRPGAGRKLAPGKRRGVAHRRREHAFDKPLHITARLADDIPNVRERTLYLIIEEAIRAANERFG